MSKGHTHTTEAPEPVQTLDELLATLRNDAAEDIAYSPNDIRRLANQIESAAKRDYEEVKSYFEKLHDGPSMVCTVKNCALRNAAEDIVEQVKAEASLGHFAPAVVEDRAVGNAAAMRGALENLVHRKCPVSGSCSKSIAEQCEHPSCVWYECRAAIAAPARNCDRYATAKDALDAFIREKEIKSADVDNMNLRDFFDWLFAPAEGGAKCVNGLRGVPDCRGCNEHCEDVRKRNCFYWNPDIEGGVCSLTGKKSCPISCDNFHIPEKVSPPPAEGGEE